MRQQSPNANENSILSKDHISRLSKIMVKVMPLSILVCFHLSACFMYVTVCLGRYNCLFSLNTVNLKDISLVWQLKFHMRLSWTSEWIFAQDEWAVYFGPTFLWSSCVPGEIWYRVCNRNIQIQQYYIKTSFLTWQVQTGFGRTGSHFWGFQGHNVIPDMVTMAKGIGNGFPMGAVVTTPGEIIL